MHLIEIKNLMTQLKIEALKPPNKALLDKIGYNNTCTNMQLIRAIKLLKEQPYLNDIANKIVIQLVIKYDGNITKEIINNL